MKPHNLVELLACSVKRTPHHSALIWFQDGKQNQMSYQKLWNTIQDLAMGLDKIGIRSGDKVAIYAHNNPRWLISELAVLSLGAISVPIEPNLPTKQVKTILNDAEVMTIILENEHLFKQLSQITQLTKHQIMMYKGESLSPTLSFETVIQIGQTIALESEKWFYTKIQSSDPATLLYPTEANSTMYGALLSHGHFLNNLKATNYMIPVDNLDICYSELSFAHPLCRMVGYLSILYHGATISFSQHNQPIKAILEINQPTLLLTKVTTLQTIFDQLQFELEKTRWLKKKGAQWANDTLYKQHKLTKRVYKWSIPASQTLRYSIARWFMMTQLQKLLGGKLRMIVTHTSLPPEVSQFFQSIYFPIIQAFCLPECTALVTSNPLYRIKPNTMGISIPGVDIRLANGQLMIKSPFTMMGYYNKPEETANKIVNGWYYTGLSVKIDTEGYISLVDPSE